MPRVHRRRIHTETARRRRSKAVDDDVALLRERVEDACGLGRAKIQRHTSLTAVEPFEKDRAVAMRGQVAHAVAAARILDLDHIRAEVREHQRRVGARKETRQIEDANAIEWRHRAISAPARAACCA
jgi:hypothetical protein